MFVRKFILGFVVIAATAAVMVPGAASAAVGPVWQLQPDANTFETAGSTLQYHVTGLNVGDAPTSGSYQVTATLPAGLTAVAQTEPFGGWTCTGNGPGVPPSVAGASVVTCTGSTGINPLPGTTSKLNFDAAMDPAASGALITTFEIAGGGATQPGGQPCGQAPAFAAPACATASKTTTITSTPEFGVDAFDGQATGDRLGTPFTQAGGHPYEASTQIDFNTASEPALGHLFPVEPTRDVIVDLPPGLVGNPTSIAQCTMEQLAYSPLEAQGPLCPAESQIGVAKIRAPFGGDTAAPATLTASVYNMVPPPAVPARFAMNVLNVIVTLDGKVRTGGDYGLSIDAHNISEGLGVFGSTFTFWGTPSDPSHDARRQCPGQFLSGCSSAAAPKPFLRLPTSCTPPGVGLVTGLRADSWTNPGVFAQASFESHLPLGYPLAPQDWGPPQGPTGCEKLRFDPALTATPPAPRQTGRPSGFAFDLSMSQADDPNTGTGPADVRKVVTRLPEGVRLSPSAASGLAGCSPAQIALDSDADASCPDGSKIGSLSIETPLLDDPLSGAIYLATPHDNPSGTLLAVYLVAKGPGVTVKLPGKVELDPATGRLTATFDNNPQLPFEHLHLQFTDGPRAALVTPRQCGTYTTHTVLTSWSGKTVDSDSSFTVSKDGNGAPCGAPRFSPTLVAGTTNPIAGGFSPFALRLQRSDDDGEFKSLSSLSLPPGLSASLRGTTYCPDATLAAADTSTTPAHTGAQELAAPSCPASSRIGSATIGAGAGSSPFYVESGKVYLAGPYKGAPLSLAVSVPAVAGPFDLGNVIVRSALYVDPSDASLRAVSDPFPAMLEGIALQVRDIRVNVDRPHFTLNPTNCTPMSIDGTVLSTENQTAAVHSRFQAGECAALGFKPKLALRLKGGTRRGDHPQLRATLTARPGDANIGRASVALPHSEFLDQAHIGTVCTRVQFAAAQCPARSVYGRARAITPLLDAPLEGPVYLRSSDNKLPDLVADLNGQIHIVLAGRIDSVNGRIRNTFDLVPDAPVTKFVLTMRGGKKGLLENSTNLCARPHKATVKIGGQNGRAVESNPALAVQCRKAPKKH